MDLSILLAISLLLLAIIIATTVGIFIIRELRKQQFPTPTPTPTNPNTQKQFTTPTITPTQKTDNAKLYRQPAMSRAESSFYDFLKATLGDHYLIETKKPLAEIFKRYGWLDRKLWTMHTRGHIDFLVIEPRTKNPLLAIELDDWTHNKPERQDADRRKEELFQRGEMKLLRFKVGKVWGEEERRIISEALPHQAERSATSLTKNL